MSVHYEIVKYGIKEIEAFCDWATDEPSDKDILKYALLDASTRKQSHKYVC